MLIVSQQRWVESHVCCKAVCILADGTIYRLKLNWTSRDYPDNEDIVRWDVLYMCRRGKSGWIHPGARRRVMSAEFRWPISAGACLLCYSDDSACKLIDIISTLPYGFLILDAWGSAIWIWFLIWQHPADRQAIRYDCDTCMRLWFSLWNMLRVSFTWTTMFLLSLWSLVTHSTPAIHWFCEKHV
jgi:hypothetical protein